MAESVVAMEIRDSINQLTEAVEELRDAVRENTLADMSAGMLVIGRTASRHGMTEDESHEAAVNMAHALLQDAHEALVRFNHAPERS